MSNAIKRKNVFEERTALRRDASLPSLQFKRRKVLNRWLGSSLGVWFGIRINNPNFISSALCLES